MDGLDRKILKELIKNNVIPFPSPALRKSFRKVGKTLKVDQGTIRNRIRRFRQNGLLKEFYLGVNPSLFARKIAALWFDVHPEAEKDHIRNAVSRMDGTLLVCDYLGPKLSTVFCYADDDDLKKITRQITRMANSENVLCQTKPFLNCSKMNLRPSDWAIIRSLQLGDPSRKSYSLIARETGLSTKTVKKRVAMMAEEGAIYLLASLNLSSFQGFVPVDLTIIYQHTNSTNDLVETVKEFLGEMLVFADVEDKDHGYFALAVSSIARIREIQKWLGKCTGVRSAQIEILHDIISLKQFYETKVSSKLEIPVKVHV